MGLVLDAGFWLGAKAGNAEWAVGWDMTCHLSVTAWAFAQDDVWVSRLSLTKRTRQVIYHCLCPSFESYIMALLHGSKSLQIQG